MRHRSGLIRPAARSRGRMTGLPRGIKIMRMSVAEIIAELPKLTPADLRMVRRKLIELAEENDEVAACDAAAALDGAQTLDRLEAEDDAR